MNRILWNRFKWFLRTGNRRSYVVIRSGVVMPLQQRSCIWWHLYTFKPHRAKPKVKHVSSSITKLFKGESETVADRKSTDTRWSKQKRPKTSSWKPRVSVEWASVLIQAGIVDKFTHGSKGSSIYSHYPPYFSIESKACCRGRLHSCLKAAPIIEFITWHTRLHPIFARFLANVV